MAKTFDNIFEASTTNCLYLFAQRTLSLSEDVPPTPPPLNALGLPCHAIQAMLAYIARLLEKKAETSPSEKASVLEPKTAASAADEVADEPAPEAEMGAGVVAAGAVAAGAVAAGAVAAGAVAAGAVEADTAEVVDAEATDAGAEAAEEETKKASEELKAAATKAMADKARSSAGRAAATKAMAGSVASEERPAVKRVETTGDDAIAVLERVSSLSLKTVAIEAVAVHPLEPAIVLAAAAPAAAAEEEEEEEEMVDPGKEKEEEKETFAEKIAPLAKKITTYILDHQDDSAQEERWRTTMKRDMSKNFRLQREAALEAAKKQRELIDSLSDKQRDEMQSMEQRFDDVHTKLDETIQLVRNLANPWPR